MAKKDRSKGDEKQVSSKKDLLRKAPTRQPIYPPPTKTAAMVKSFRDDKELGLSGLADWLEDMYNLGDFATLLRLTKGGQKPEHEYHYSTPDFHASSLEPDVFVWMAVHDSTLEVGIYVHPEDPDDNVNMQYWYRFGEEVKHKPLAGRQQPPPEVGRAVAQLNAKPLED